MELAREVGRLCADMAAERAARLAAAGELRQAGLEATAALLDVRQTGEDAAELRGKLGALAPSQSSLG